MNDTATTLPDTLHTLTAPALFGTGRIPEILEQISQAARALIVDISTAKGRRECASLAARVARSKTYLDGLGKDYVAEIKARAGLIDAERRQIRDTLDALRDEVRAPLTAWEQAEADRQQRHVKFIRMIQAWGQADETLPAAIIRARITDLTNAVIDASLEEYQAEAQTAKDASLYRLNTLLAAAEAREAEEARLAAEREAQAQAEREEREHRIAEAAAIRAKAEAEAEAKRLALALAAEEHAERQRLEREIATAKAEAERAQREAARAAARAHEEQAATLARAKAEEIARQQELEEVARAAAKRERERIASLAAEAEIISNQRRKDQEHASQIRREARDDLSAVANISTEHAEEIIRAVHKGIVRHISIQY